MLKRIRIEVDSEDNAEKCSEALDRYEHALLEAEATRAYKAGLLSEEAYDAILSDCHFQAGHRFDLGWDNRQFGRSITDEVIELQSESQGYRGRRVVAYALDSLVE